MLQPIKVKHRKQHRLRGSFAGKATRGAQLAFGSFGLKTMEPAEITSRQIEAARRAMTHSLKRSGKLWIRIFPHKPITRKAAEVPMGAGKGSVEYYVALVRPGNILFELDGLTDAEAREALKLAAYKLPVKTKIISRIS